jgi:hypothetical protein
MLWAFNEDENGMSRQLAAKGGSYV